MRHWGRVYGLSGAVPSSVHQSGRHVMLIWSPTRDGNSDHLGKAVSRFFYSQVTIFPFIINKYLMGRSYFEATLLSITYQTLTH